MVTGQLDGAMEGIDRSSCSAQVGETNSTHQKLSGDREERNGDIEDEVAQDPATRGGRNTAVTPSTNDSYLISIRLMPVSHLYFCARFIPHLSPIPTLYIQYEYGSARKPNSVSRKERRHHSLECKTRCDAAQFIFFSDMTCVRQRFGWRINTNEIMLS